MSENLFQFKSFAIRQSLSPARVGTDGVLLGAWAGQGCQPGSLLDLGTGTGLIALMLAQRFPQARVVAVDVHADSAQEARHNASASPWADRITVLHQDANAVAGLPMAEFDLVVSNPPFFRDSTASPDADRHRWRHQENLDPEALFRIASATLSPDGRLAMVLPLEAEPAPGQSEAHGLYLRRAVRVRHQEGHRFRRILLEYQREAGPCASSDLSLQHSQTRKDVTPEFAALCRDFYPWLD